MEFPRTFLDVIRKKKVGGVVDPRELKDCIAKTASRFSDNNQEVWRLSLSNLKRRMSQICFSLSRTPMSFLVKCWICFTMSSLNTREIP